MSEFKWSDASNIHNECYLWSSCMRIKKLLVVVADKTIPVFGWYNSGAECWYIENSPSHFDVTHYAEMPSAPTKAAAICRECEGGE